MTKNKQLWQALGLAPESMALADQAMPHALALVRILATIPDPRSFALTLLDEALFQVLELPKRTARDE